MDLRAVGARVVEQGEELGGRSLGLAAAVAGLRAELAEAITAGAGDQVRFALGPVKVELGLELERTRGAEGGVKLWVVTLNGKAGSTSGATHKVTLELTPTDGQGRPLGLISGREPASPTTSPSPEPDAGSAGRSAVGRLLSDRE